MTDVDRHPAALPPSSATVIFQSRRLAVLHKPSGTSLLADRSGAPCLWDSLESTLGGKPFLVHRLDKGTSGVLLVALDQDTQRRLTQAFQRRQVRKYYLAWTTGSLTGAGTLRIDLPLRKGRKSRYRVAGNRNDIRRNDHGWFLPSNVDDGHAALTRVRVLRRTSGRTLLMASPATGRTHQLRVHLSWIGHAILGDHLYGRPAAAEQQAPRLQLHCHRLVVPELGTFTAAARDGWLA